jgi:hypothetical protein
MFDILSLASLTILIVIFVDFVSHESGVVAENTRIYEQCIQKNSELSVAKATELCKEIVK